MKTSWIDSQAELAARQAEINERPLPKRTCFLTPQPGRVIIEQDDVKRKSSIIYTPTDKEPRPTTGTVIAVPDDAQMTIQWIGKKVLFAQFSGICLNFKNCPNWRVLQVDEILAVFNNSDDQHELDTNVV
jgi:co-chaperonin GroES (HSP10)